MIFFISQMPANCQTTAKIDSLNQVLITTDDEKARVDILNKIAENYLPINPEIADSVVNQSIAIAEKSSYEQGIMDGFFLSFKINKAAGKTDQALIRLRKVGEMQYKKGNMTAYASSLVNEGNLLMKKQELKNATEVLLKAIEIYKTFEGSDLSLLYTTLGQINQLQGKYTDALAYHDRSLSINLEKKFDKGISANYVNIGNVYSDQQNFLKATEYYLKALEIKERMVDNQGIMKCLNNLGVMAMKLSDTKNALIYHQKALEYAIGNKNEHDIAMCYINFGYDYLYANSFENAIINSLKGNEIALKINNIPLLKESSLVLSESYANLHQFSDAYKFQVLLKQYSDSLVKENNLKELNEIQTKYETAQKDNQIQELKISTADKELQLQRQKVYVVIFIGLLIIVMVLVLFFYLQSKSSRKIQIKLQEINDIKTAFFANLSHEFRTPLTLMLGPVEKLIENADEKSRSLLQLVHRNASRLLALDEQLLEFTKLDSGTQKLNLSKGDIIPLISAIAASFTFQAEKKNIRITQEFPSETPSLYFDTDIIEKVVGNLLSNAIKYTPEGGKVFISVGIVESVHSEESNKQLGMSKSISIQLTDNGQGIPYEKQKSIFERFYQLENQSSASFDGYGIGLALVKELIQLHKGTILLKSQVGMGSEFTILLPLNSNAYSSAEIQNSKSFDKENVIIKSPLAYDEETPVSQSRSELLDKKSNQQQSKLLFVDDNSDMRAFIHETFHDQFHLLLASDGDEGLQIAIHDKPDLVLTDVMMERMDGLEFCKLLKTNPKTQLIPVIMLTALTTVDDKIAGLEHGADDYMLKPFSSKELIARINNLIDQRQKLKDFFSKELKIEPAAVTISSAEAVFLTKLIKLIEDQIDNPDLEIEHLASKMGMSRSQLYRKVTSTTKQTAVNFVKIIRIKRAAQLIEQRAGNVSEIMYSVGFNNLSYFSKCFKEVYQLTPSEFYNQSQQNISA
jgi:signal transduction histidine kinase/DNA-binding response OmpR family regulator